MFFSETKFGLNLELFFIKWRSVAVANQKEILWKGLLTPTPFPVNNPLHKSLLRHEKND